MKNAAMLRAALVAIATFGAGAALGAWDRQVVDVGGMPGFRPAFSTATSKVYLPLLQQRALIALDGDQYSRLELDIRPTAIGYSAGTARLFVAGMFDNAVIAIDEATGAKTRIAVGVSPDHVLVDDARGKVYVTNWGGIAGQGSLSIIDSQTLAVRNVPLQGAVASFAQDSRTGGLFAVLEGRLGATTLVALDAEGNVLAREELGHQGYSLAVDSRTGHVYSAALSHRPQLGADTVTRTFRVYAQPGLRLVTRHDWPAGRDFFKLNFMVDPVAPGLYFGSGNNTTLFRLDAAGHNLEMWNLPLGTFDFESHTYVNGIFGIDADPGTGNLFISAPIGSMVAEFNVRTGATEIIEIPGAVGFSAVHFWPDGNRMLVPDGPGEFQLTVLKRAVQAE